MGQLTNQFVSQSYQGLLNLQNTNTGFTTNLQTITDGLGGTSPLQISKTQVNISGAFTVNGQPISVDSGSLVTTSSFNAYTSSNDSKVNSLISQTGSYVTEAESGSFMITGSVAGDTLTFTKGNGSQFSLQVNTGSLPSGVISGSQQIVDLGFLQTSSFNSYTSSNDSKVNSLIANTGSYATTSSLTSLSQSIATTDLGQNNRLSSLETATGSLQNQINQKLDTGSFNTYTSSNDGKVNSLISKTGSYATTGSNTFNGDQTISSGYKLIVDEINPNGSAINITGSLNVTNEITALSASITYLQTIYQTSSVIFTSGSNILGDEPSDVQTLNGRVDIPLGNLNVTGSTTSSLGFFGNLQGTASFASNALSSSHSVNSDTAISASQAQNAVSASHSINSDTAISASQAQNSVSSSYSSFALSSSFAENAHTASYIKDSILNQNLNITGSLTASGLFYPTVDGSERTFLQTDGNGNLSLQYVESMIEPIYNGEATTLLKGTPVYVSGSQGANPIVFRADAADPNKMPAIYIVDENLGTAQVGIGILLGKIEGVNTTGFPAGTEIFVGSGGGFTDTRPTGSGIVQSLGIVTKEGAGGQGIVLNPGPASLPNIQEGYVWVGNSNSYPVAVSTSSFIEDLSLYTTTASFNSYTSSTDGRLNSLESFTGSIDTNFVSEVEFGAYTSSNDGKVNSLISATGSYATTGSNVFKGDQIITGSMTVTGSAIINRDNVSIQYLGSSFGGNVGVLSVSNNTEVGLALDGATWTTNWSTGPILYVNNTAGDTYEAVFGFQNKANYTDGRVTVVKPIVFNSGATGSLQGTASYATQALSASYAPQDPLPAGLVSGSSQISYTGITDVPSGIISGSGQLTGFGFATTGSNTFIGNQVITGSVLISGSSAVDLKVVGNIVSTGSSLINTDNVNVQYLGSSFGGNLGVFNLSDNTEVGLALDGAQWTTNWSNGPIMYVNNTPGDTYEGVFGFQNKTNYTDGRITALKPMVFNAGVTGSFNVTGSTTFSGNNGFPVNVNGTISSQRFSFVGNPFNSNLGGTFGSLKFDGNNTRLEYVNNDLGTPATKSAVYLTTNTGSNFTSVENQAEYAGSIASTLITNTSGTRTFNVNVDSSAFTGSLTVSGGITGSLEGTASFATTASFALNGGGGGSAFPYVGTAIITGSLVITGSAGASVNATNGILTQYFGNSFGGNIGINKNSDFTEVGLALDGASWTGNWSNGPILYVNNNPGDTYDAVFGFQDKTNFTDGRVTVLKPMVFNAGVTGSFSVTGSTTFSGNNAFPVNVDGTLTSKRIIFGGNPFNSTFGGTLGSLNYDGNNTRLEYINADFGTPQTSSYSYLTTNTGSNVTTVENGANYGGTTAKTVVSNNNGTRTFEVDVNRTTITGSVQGNVNALSISSNTASLNLNDGNFFTLQLVSGSATHINPSNIKPGQTINILLNTTGSGTVNFPSSVKQISGSAYVPTTTTGTDIITLVSFDSTNLYLANVKNLV